jgi:hypothetical protein
VPFQLTAIPAGTHVVSCQVILWSKPFPVLDQAWVTIGDGQGKAVNVYAEPSDESCPTTSAPLAHDIMITCVGLTRVWANYSGFSRAEATRVLEGVRSKADPADVSTWPTTLVAG